jgi:ribosomal protein S18 acetylase RimI-like enzyme
MSLTLRDLADDDYRRVLDLAHETWRHGHDRLNFETSFGTLAWEGGPAVGCTKLFELAGRLIGWARLAPGYDRIRRMDVWDRAPASLVWMVDWRDSAAPHALESILEWAEDLAEEPFTTSHAIGDLAALTVLEHRGYGPDPSEPFGIYLQQPLPAPSVPPPDGYVFTTMAELNDLDVRAEAHRVGWPASTRSADDVRETMATWPYRPDLDIVVTTRDGTPVGSAIVWYDDSYDYGEFEPVGIAADHRRQGVAAAMLRFGLERLTAAGASYAVVGARGDDDYPAARRLYRSVGFQLFMTQQIVRKVS